MVTHGTYCGFGEFSNGGFELHGGVIKKFETVIEGSQFKWLEIPEFLS